MTQDIPNPLIPLNFGRQQIRIQINKEGNPWFNANDVCVALGYATPRDAVATHVDKDDVAKSDVIDSMGRNQRSNYINESGVYALIFGSTKPEAKIFKKWVTSEVLPAIRKHGKYQDKPIPLPHPMPKPIAHSITNVILFSLYHSLPGDATKIISELVPKVKESIIKMGETLHQYAMARHDMTKRQMEIENMHLVNLPLQEQTDEEKTNLQSLVPQVEPEKRHRKLPITDSMEARFIEIYQQTGNASQAYREAVSSGDDQKLIHAKASAFKRKLIAKGKLANSNQTQESE
ncbi:MAG: hypothetical protein G8345_00780 [Magnetococcales bacterium]|nr:hypothetical protein [Magnetococcales bacterium]NGZ25403.1 hypothetical protein [Magnetococcales bacterium]